MIDHEKLLFDGVVVAELSDLRYETPWASAKPEFHDPILRQKLKALTEFRSFDLELESMGLEDKEEEVIWERKLSELGLSHSDLELDKNGHWAVSASNSKSVEIFSISYYGGVLQWRV